MKLITNPDEFFEELKQKDVRIKIPLLTVMIPPAVLLSIYQYFLMNKISQAFPKELAQFFLVGAYIGIAGSFIGVFAVWLILAVIMHGISSFFDGKGSFRRTFEFVGYGFLPSLIGSAITVPMSLNYVMNVEVPKITIAQLQQNPNVVKTVMLSLIPKSLIYSNLIVNVAVTIWSLTMLSLIPKSLIYSNLIINIAITIWSLTIWTFAVKHAREIELRKAFVSALIPTVLFGIYQLWNLLKFL